MEKVESNKKSERIIRRLVMLMRLNRIKSRMLKSNKRQGQVESTTRSKLSSVSPAGTPGRGYRRVRFAELQPVVVSPENLSSRTRSRRSSVNLILLVCPRVSKSSGSKVFEHGRKLSNERNLDARIPQLRNVTVVFLRPSRRSRRYGIDGRHTGRNVKLGNSRRRQGRSTEESVRTNIVERSSFEAGRTAGYVHAASLILGMLNRVRGTDSNEIADQTGEEKDNEQDTRRK